MDVTPVFVRVTVPEVPPPPKPVPAVTPSMSPVDAATDAKTTQASVPVFLIVALAYCAKEVVPLTVTPDAPESVTAPAPIFSTCISVKLFTKGTLALVGIVSVNPLPELKTINLPSSLRSSV